MIDIAKTLLALAIPTFLGVVLLRLFQPLNARLPYGHAASMTGLGYLLGMLMMTVILRLWSALGFTFSFGLIATLAVALGLAGIAVTPALRRGSAWRPAQDPSSSTMSPLTIASILLLALIALRFAMLAVEVAWRPLYPWDAWAQWATKAHAWYASGRMAPFVWPHEWLAMREALVFVDQAPHYPATVPLVQVWHALALARFDESWINMPWVATGAALIATFHGQLRAIGYRPFPAAVAAYGLASLPFLNTHIALAGYAELHLAAYYGAAAMLLMRWVDSVATPEAGRVPWSTWAHASRRLLLLACIFAAALPLIKRPGVFWALSLSLPFVILVLPRAGNWLLLAGSTLAVTTLSFLSLTGMKIFNYQLVTDTDVLDVAKSLAQNLFAMGNWHLFWYAFLATIMLTFKLLWRPRNDAHTAIIAFGLFFLGCVFFFSVAGDWVSDFTTVNRAIIHMVPAVAFYMALMLRHRFPAWLETPPVLHDRVRAPAKATPATTATSAIPLAPEPPASPPVFAPVLGAATKSSTPR